MVLVGEIMTGRGWWRQIFGWSWVVAANLWLDVGGGSKFMAGRRRSWMIADCRGWLLMVAGGRGWSRMFARFINIPFNLLFKFSSFGKFAVKTICCLLLLFHCKF